ALAVSAGLLTKTWDVAASGLMTLADLLKYDAVVWFTGDDSTTSLTAEEQNLVSDYLNSGGKLLLSGRNIAYDLVGNGTPADSAFFRHVLHAQFAGETTDEYMAMGARDDVFFRSAVVYFRGNFGGAGNQKSLPALEPVDPAIIAFQYLPDLKVAGVRYEDQANGSRIIYAGFGLEGIAGPTATSGATLLQKSISWLLGTTRIAAKEDTRPLDFTLMQNYPNPFNPNTHITFSLPQPAKVEVSVYNTLGQRVQILFQGKLGKGVHYFEWNGQNADGSQVSSGVYLLRINAKYGDEKDANKIVKMVKLQ
ncbi:MAG: T9SS type A sorting domain-containing protein, partial [Actinobacteria bacterium]|nr:T9SS type A sorting domain-containing protein [Actinomycetota bacterium]